MGDFWAHLQAGGIFIVLGFWWMYHSFTEHIKCVSEGRVFVSKIYYETRYSEKNRYSKWPPFEIIMRTMFALIGFLGEFFDEGFGFHDPQGNFTKLMNMIHCTIYGIFVLQGLLDLMVHYRFPIPKNLNYLVFGLGFLWFGVSFFLHELYAGDKAPLERLCHQLQMISLFPLGVIFLIEMNYRKGLICMFSRTLFTLTLGTFFVEMAFILFIHDGRFPALLPAPDWDQKDMRNVHYVMAAYGAHIAMNLTVMVVVYLLIAFIYRKKHGLNFLLDKPRQSKNRTYKKVHDSDEMNIGLLNDEESV